MRKYAVIFFILLAPVFISAQLSGSYTIPGSFPDIATAISNLNTSGVSGPVTINVSAGYTELAPVGGYSLYAVPGASSLNTITFQKSGTGANPLITAYTGVCTSTAAVEDGVWSFIGADYITVDAIDIADNNTTNPATMEFGYGFCRANASDGCQYNTIRNCVITLNKINTASVAASGSYKGSRGIDLASVLPGAYTTPIIPVGTSGTNSYNTFYGNLIQNCQIGIAMLGTIAGSSPSTYVFDTNNDIGGNSVLTGNTIFNFTDGAVETSGESNLNVSFNTINNIGGGGTPALFNLYGIRCINNIVTANVSANSNTVTAVTTGTSNGLVSCIEVAAAGSPAPQNNTITISNNVFANCVFQRNTSSTDNIGIQSAEPCAVLNIENNVFSNITGNANGGNVYLINNTYGGVTSGTGTVNINTNSLSINCPGLTSNSGKLYGIYNAPLSTGYAMDANINSNSFSNFNFSGTVPGGYMWYIYNSLDKTHCTINNNLWNNLSVRYGGTQSFIEAGGIFLSLSVSSNSLIGGYTQNVTSAPVSLISVGGTFSATSTQTISNNNFSNIVSTGTVTPSTLSGIHLNVSTLGSQPNASIFNNVISNLNTPLTGTTALIYCTSYGTGSPISSLAVYNNTLSSISTGGSITGIFMNSAPSATVPIDVYSNVITNLSSSSAASSTVSGIAVSTYTAGPRFYKNKIGSLTASGASANAYGFFIQDGKNVSVFNNLIGELSAPTSTVVNSLNGIYIQSAASVSLYYNTVHLNATSSASYFSSNAVLTNTATLLDMRDNIFVNSSVPKGTGITSAYRRLGVNLSTYSTTSNNNLFYAGVPSNSCVIYADGATTYSILGSYQYAVTGHDNLSVTELPPFTTTVSSSPNFLSISTTTPTQVESAATPVSGISDDYAGTLRNASTPDIGAWEGNYMASDKTPPFLLSHGFTTGYCSLTSRTYTANLADSSNLATGTFAPRIYYKVNSGPYTSCQGTLTSGTLKNGTWTFNLTYTATLYSTISYYLVAQDAVATPNLMSFPLPGFSGFDVNTITTPPSPPDTYTLGSVLNGTYTVGSSGNFTTLTGAALAYNQGCLTGPVTYVLTNPSYSTAETFPVTFRYNPMASATNSLLIKPASAASIASTGTISSTLKFINTKHITIDGVNASGSSLTVVNSCPSINTAPVWLASATSSIQGNTDFTIKNTNIAGTNNTNPFNYGICISADGTDPGFSPGADNDSISILSNTITACSSGISCIGSASVSAGGIDNLLIRKNVIGAASMTNTMVTVGGSGIVLENAVGPFVDSNVIRNVFSNASVVHGIDLSYVSKAAVNQNTVTNMLCYSSSFPISGIHLGMEALTSTVNANVINKVQEISGSFTGARGILVETLDFNSYDVLTNNMISDISSNASDNNGRWPTGISIETTCGNFDVLYNSVWLTGSYAGSAPSISAAFYNGAYNVNLKNNLFKNTYDNSSTTSDKAYAIMLGGTFTAIDFNDYYAGAPASNPVIGFSGSDKTTMAQLQAASGGDLNSVSLNPSFVSTSDLHMAFSSANLPLENLGSPVASVSKDLDFQTRSVTTPDMGADEYTLLCSAANAGTVSPLSIKACPGNTVSLSSAGAPVYLNTAFQWQVSPSSGGPYSNVTSGTGSATASYTTAPLPAGTYYYVLYATCATSLTTISNEATVTVSAPSVSVSSSSPVICIGQTATITAGGAITYSWSTGSTSVAIAVSPTVNTTYIVTGKDSIGCTNTASVTQSVSPAPSVSVSSSAPVICVGQSVTITAGGATTYSWSTGSTSTVIVVSPAVNTTYTVTGKDSFGCTNTASITQSVSLCTGLEDPAPDKTISVFPNPSEGNIAVLSSVDLTLMITNGLGECLRVIEIRGGETRSVGLHELAAGAYTIIGQSGESYFKQKLIIIK